MKLYEKIYLNYFPLRNVLEEKISIKNVYGKKISKKKIALKNYGS